MTYIKHISGPLAVAMLALAAPANGAEIGLADPARPTAVIIAQNEMTEITDFLVPYAVLSASGAFEVVTVSTKAGLVNLWPNLTAEMATTLGTVDRDLANTPDLIIVPAIHDYNDPELIAWLRRHAESGAFIAAICDGVLVTASAGLLDGQMATGHFYSADKRQRRFKTVSWVKDTRYVVSDNTMSTSGVSASLPASLKLVERFAGPEAARRLAATYGVDDYGPAHDSSRFEFGMGEWWRLLKNLVRTKSDYQVVLTNGIDEYSLAFTLDLLSRTLRASVYTVSKAERIRTAHGLTLIPSNVLTRFESDKRVQLPVANGNGSTATSSTSAKLIVESPADTIDTVLSHIASKFGRETAHLTATQLEFVWQ